MRTVSHLLRLECKEKILSPNHFILHISEITVSEQQDFISCSVNEAGAAPCGNYSRDGTRNPV